MNARHLIRALPLLAVALFAPLAVAQGFTGENDFDAGGCIEEGRSRGRGLSERAFPVYPFAVGSRVAE